MPSIDRRNLLKGALCASMVPLSAVKASAITILPKNGIAPDEPGYGKQFYIDRFGPRSYAFDHKGVHFAVLDATGITPDRTYGYSTAYGQDVEI